MSGINWDKIAEKAASQTDEDFNKELASLTNLKISEVDVFIKNCSITNQNALETLKVINDATITNHQKATTIASLKNGVGFLIQLATKIV